MRTNQAKLEKISISGAIQLGFLHSLVNAIRCEESEQPAARRETTWHLYSQNVEGPAAPLSLSSAACGCCERARQSDSKNAQLFDMMSRIVAHDRLLDGSIKNAGNRQSKNQCVEGKISIVQSIQLGFSRSLGSTK